ncbi:MAG: FAD-dependent oxidoreductase [Acidobacteriota bacterium]|nr:FAD-dependent oxidoreductase [Acidobacteriota bacterium]
MRPARVIGAGLSGLVAAWHLADRGFAVEVIEQAPHPGGLIQSQQTEHGLVETGANAFVWDNTVAAWFQRLDLTPEFPQASSKRRYIFRNGRPWRWPLTVAESLGLAARLSAAFVTRATSAGEQETMEAWGRRVIGEGATRWLLEPAMQGVYASPPGVLSARAIFDGRRRGLRKLAAPRGGMGQFTTRLYERLCDRGVRVQFNSAGTVDAGVPTVVSTPAPAAAHLVAPHAPELAAAIARVRLASLATVTMFFEPHPDDIHGFGILFPSGTGINALGVLLNADIFAGRSTRRSETWIVGDRDQGLTAFDDDRLVQMLAADRRRVTGRDATPLSVHLTRRPAAIPVYDAAIGQVAPSLASLPPWLALAGNYLGRLGVAALLEQGAAAANRVRESAL